MVVLIDIRGIPRLPSRFSAGSFPLFRSPEQGGKCRGIPMILHKSIIIPEHVNAEGTVDRLES